MCSITKQDPVSDCSGQEWVFGLYVRVGISTKNIALIDSSLSFNTQYKDVLKVCCLLEIPSYYLKNYGCDAEGFHFALLERDRRQLPIKWAKGQKLIVVTKFQFITSHLALTGNSWPVKLHDSLPSLYTSLFKHRNFFIWTICCAHISSILWLNGTHLHL